MEYKAQYQEYLLQATAALDALPAPVFCPRNRKYAELPVTACWAVESASARF